MKKNYLLLLIFLMVVGIGGYFVLVSPRGKQVIQSHRSYELEIVSGASNVKPQQSTSIVYKIKNDKGEVLKKFEVAHEKIMHFILVRHDLQQFQHIHPEYNGLTGEFTIDVTFLTDGPYRLFPDFTPSVDNPQKLPVTVYVDIQVGDIGNYTAQAVTPETEKTKSEDGYEIIYTLPQQVQKQEELTYSLEVAKDNLPVTDLESYLGALGHSVIIKKETLDFIHTHAGETDGNQGVQHDGAMTGNTENKGPKIEFGTTFPQSGIYKIFTQFQHQGKILTTDYVVQVN